MTCKLLEFPIFCEDFLAIFLQKPVKKIVIFL